MTRNELAAAIATVATLHGTFKLRSGAESSVYFDKYLFEADPELLRSISLHMKDLIPGGVDFLAGLEMGGIPIATMLAQQTGLPNLFVRKEAKAYGTCKIAEGQPFDGKRVVIVEDVVTSGGQILLSAAELRKRGAVIDTVLCVIDREAGGADNLANEGLTLKPLFTRTDMENA